MADDAQGRIDVTVRIDRAFAGKLDDVVARLRRHGLSEIQRSDRFLLVNGSAAPNQLEALAKLEGVVSVRPDRRYHPI